MTGRELLLVMCGATALGGAAGIGAAMVGGAERAPAPPPPDTGGILSRLESLEGSLRKTERERDELRAAVASLRDRVREAEDAAAGARAALADAPSGFLSPEIIEASGHGDLSAALEKARAGVEGDLLPFTKDARFRLGEGGKGVLLGRLDRASATLGGLVNGLHLRTLPEEDRWAKAKEEIGLTDPQVEDLRGAFRERDRALEDALVTEKSEDDGSGGTFTVRRLDRDRAAAANRTFRDRVDAALTPDQRKSWDDKGYGHAFGKTPVGATGTLMVTTMESTSVDSAGESVETGGDGKE